MTTPLTLCAICGEPLEISAATVTLEDGSEAHGACKIYEPEEDEVLDGEDSFIDESMDGDAESALASVYGPNDGYEDDGCDYDDGGFENDGEF